MLNEANRSTSDQQTPSRVASEIPLVDLRERGTQVPPQSFPISAGVKAATEPLPIYYHAALESSESLSVDEQMRFMLEILRQDLLWPQVNEVTMRTLYGVARSIADTELKTSADPLHNPGITILDQTRAHGTPPNFATNIPSDDTQLYGVQSEWGIQLNWKQILGDRADDLSLRFREEGVALVNEYDINLLSALHIMAHEAGHAVLYGIGEFAKNQYLAGNHMLASQLSLLARPEEGFTGDWEMDTWIQEERFAEGYAMVATKKALELLGYDKEAVKVAPDCFGQIVGLGAPVGVHQLDNLNSANAYLNPKTLVAHGDIRAPEIKMHQQDYLGNLGYSAPLDADEILIELDELDKIVARMPTPAVRMFLDVRSNPASETWRKEVRERQSIKIRTRIKELQLLRKEVLLAQAQEQAAESEVSS